MVHVLSGPEDEFLRRVISFVNAEFALLGQRSVGILTVCVRKISAVVSVDVALATLRGSVKSLFFRLSCRIHNCARARLRT